MDFNKIKSGLERLSRLADGWEHNGVSALERDIALDELRKIYSAIRFVAADDVAVNVETVQTDTVEVVPVSVVEQIAVEVAEAAVPVPEHPEIAETTAVLDAPEVTAASEAPAEQAAAEDSAADSTERNTADEVEPQSSASTDKNEPQNLDGVQSLFNEDELPVGNRRRLIMMSLYGDDTAATYREEKNDPNAGNVEAVEQRAVDTEPVADVSRETATTNEAAVGSNVAQGVDIETRVVDRSPANASAFSADSAPAADNSAPSVTETAGSVSQLLENEQPSESELVLGEVINNDLRTVADTITPALNIAETAGREHVDDLNEAIGINDRFLLIRDLFGGRTSVYEEAIRKINGFDNLDDCMVYIVENFDWNPNADATKLLMQLIERKYNR